MYAVISSDEIQLPPGSVVRLPGTWQEYQTLCDRRGDGSIPRIKYHSGEVFLMSPLAKHGRDASLIADLIKVLLDWTGREYDAFTPVTMQLPEESGIEPDYCFYIDHWQAVSGKERIDWLHDPPPDLVLEIDVTSYSDAQDYLPYRVPEVWLFRNQKLLIYQLQGDEYSVQSQSQYFPEVNLADVVAQCLTLAYQRNTSAAIRNLKQQLVDTDQKSS
ncbi:Uma2 family endonuclease [Roseofilum sp. BLCC_M91]|uniref:Uma2 family endonuclease n=1 Tax=Roseofilum halophilum BLCC-M91 TaxID=3022259 RepID=A0ABT7BH76_9CYAN|nr:Uma2 family endonuclease [Roseofilum halophilum]MDJ1177846.1 Uma2 family endonuclease [Roseofilum halophilum BLCC-M91]